MKEKTLKCFNLFIIMSKKSPTHVFKIGKSFITSFET